MPGGARARRTSETGLADARIEARLLNPWKPRARRTGKGRGRQMKLDPFLLRVSSLGGSSPSAKLPKGEGG